MNPTIRACAVCCCAARLLAAQSSGPAPVFPIALKASTRALSFHVSTPASGALESQVRAAMAELSRKADGGRVIKLRVFAVGAGALDTARSVITRVMAERKSPLPVLSLAGVAAFPDTTQRVEIESTVEQAAADPNSLGVAFIAGAASATGERSIAALAKVATESGVPTASVTRVSCFAERADQIGPARSSIRTTFPNAEASYVVSYAASARPAIECEAVGKLAKPVDQGIQYFNLSGATPSAFYSHAALVSTPSVIFAAGSTALSADEPAMEVALGRVKTGVEALGGSMTNVVMGDNYWLTDAARDGIRLVRARYFGKTVPAATGVFFTGLTPASAVASIELAIAVDSI